MRKFLLVLGAIFGVLILFAAVGLGYAWYAGRGMDVQSKAYADSAVVAIVSTWDVNQLEQRATPQLVKDTDGASGQRFFNIIKTLGALKKYDGSKGQSDTSVVLGQPTRITAQYVAHAEFANGNATITVNIIKQGDQWQIYGFHVDSPVL